MNSQYERGMTWDSREGLEGMHTLDARPDEYGNSIDTRMLATIEKIEKDSSAGAAVVSMANIKAA